MLEMKHILMKFLNEISKEIKDNAQAQGRTASGRTANSLYPEATDTVGILYGSIAVNAWETGRKGGKVPAGFKQVIYEWMQDKGIFQAEKENAKRSISYFIAKKIAEQGTLLHRQGGQSGVLSNVITDERIDTFESEVLRRFGREVQNEVIISFK